MTPDEIVGLDELERRLPIKKRSPFTRVHYDLLSGALYWSDEELHDLSANATMVLRRLLRFRTTQIAETPELEFAELWSAARERCPQWIGFRPERCRPSRWLQWRYRISEKRARRIIESIEKHGARR